MVFRNRQQAAEMLANELRHYIGTDGVVLALPRGGVPLGDFIARQLAMPLDILLIKKIGHPNHAEYAVGAVSMKGSIVNESANVDQTYFDSETERIQKQLAERYHKFKGDRDPLDIKGKTVILVDDGIATGFTVKAAAQMIRSQKPGRLVIAAPVAPPRTVRELEELADEVVVLSTPSDFMAVGQFYQDFSEVSDEQVLKVLQQAG